MALPKQSTPIYELVIPSSNKRVTYRPFLVKDTKALLIASESSDESVALNTLKDIIKSCITSKVDVDTLALFDIEYIFCMLRAKSIGEVIELNVTCTQCQSKIKSSVDISKVEVERSSKHTNKFILFDDVGICMKYPTYDTLRMFKGKSLAELSSIDTIFNIIFDSIDYIYDSEQMYSAKDQSKEEIEDFINNLTKDQLAKILTFFNTIPKVKKDMSFVCPVCEHKNETRLEGLKSFF